MKLSRLTALFLLFSVLPGIVSCAGKSILPVSASSNQPDGLQPADQTPAAEDTVPENSPVLMTDFAVRLLQHSLKDDENTLVSPLSVISALAMTSNGARGETLSQMETVLGMKAGQLNTALKADRERMSKTGAGSPKVLLADSVWFADKAQFTIQPDFQKIVTESYGADVFRVPFDSGTLTKLNDWVNQNTDGMIPKILDEIPGDALMYLVSALAFDGKWEDPYTEDQVYPDTFTKEDGSQKTVDFMYSGENLWLKDGDAEGFVKRYEGGNYSFAALLPGEGTKIADYAASLDGKKLSEILSSAENTPVDAYLPKFESSSAFDLSETLSKMGMPLAFDRQKADFTGIGTLSNGNNIAISRVLHKTFISVQEEGTKAGASSLVEMVEFGAMFDPTEPKRVKLDRPFLYMLFDCETNVPFFIGIMTDPLAKPAEYNP